MRHFHKFSWFNPRSWRRRRHATAGLLQTYDFTDGILEADQTAGRLSTAYHQQPDGTWVAVASGEARFSGMRRVSQGVYSALDSEGAALPGPFGLLMEPSATNHAIKFTNAQASATLTDDVGASPISGVLYQRAFLSSTSASSAVYRGNVTLPTGVPLYLRVLVRGSNGGETFRLTTYNATDGEKSSATQTATTEWKWYYWNAPSVSVSTNIYLLQTNPLVNKTLDFACYEVRTTPYASSDSPIPTTTAAVARAVDTLTIADVPADNETRITYADDSVLDLNDWNGTAPTPTVPVVIKKIEVYAPYARPGLDQWQFLADYSGSYAQFNEDYQS